MDGSEPVRPAYKNRKGGLVFFGIVETVLGLLCLSAIALLALAYLMEGQMASRGMAMQARPALIPQIGFYGCMAVFFFVMGAGSIMGRRWARAIILVTSIYWLVAGAMVTLLLAYTMPRMMGTMAAAQSGTSGGASTLPTILGTLIVVLFMGFFFVLVPAAFVLFYRSPHVKATCEHMDPKTRWTDRVPLAVLFLTLLLASGGVMMLFTLGYSGMPFFGHVFRGPLFIFMVLLAATVALVLAYFIFLRRRWAWTATLALTLLWAISGFITMVTMKPAEMMSVYSSQKVPGMDQMMDAMKPALVILMVVGTLIWLGFLLYAVRYFKPVPKSRDAEQDHPPAI